MLANTVALLCFSMCVPPPAGTNVDGMLDAIRIVETGGLRDPNNAVGDNGRAIGAYQIHYAYWKDAVDYDPSIGGKYSDCKDPKYARRIVRSYLSRYVPKGGWNIDTVSRIHNGGPKGHNKSATRKYAEKVKNNYGSV